MTTDTELGHRLVDLELRFMKQERLLEELSDVVVDQRREIDRLKAEVKALREQLLAGVTDAANERPPHY